MGVTTRRLILRGAVQGCGLRPSLARLATQHQWSGSVRNCPEGVELILRGELPSEESLRALMLSVLPGTATLAEMGQEDYAEHVLTGFRILESTSHGVSSAAIPRDRAVCASCQEESRDPGNRRYRYPFITCAECGPRYSLLASMPFDRERTSMAAFPMCAECEREYHDPLDRRFHAQTISCPHCGPHVWLEDASGNSLARDQQAVVTAAQALKNGHIVALRGVGGYQLLVDATSPESVLRLRNRKHRPAKPLAVLCRTIEQARELAELSPLEESTLQTWENAILLLKQRRPTLIAEELNPGLNEIGLMLPTTALHEQLLEATELPLVCTSGNREGDPIVYGLEEAREQLHDLADFFLHHDREIFRPVDDSVIRVMAGRAVTFRAGRGLAPLPLALTAIDGGRTHPVLLAGGGHQKSAVALDYQGAAFLGPHLGDLETIASQDRWIDEVEALLKLTHDRDKQADFPPNVVCDPHPDYFPSCWGIAKSGIAHNAWHHHAHIVAGMLEHGWLDRTVLGVAWDGTGLGPDGSIWGGDFLWTTTTQFQRFAHFRPFALPGAEAAIRNLRRTTLSILSQLEELKPREMADLLEMPMGDLQRYQQLLNSSYSPRTTSCGRLFDSAACLILRQTYAGFEGQAAMRLEACCDPQERGWYAFELQYHKREECWEIDWRPVFRMLLRDRRRNTARGIMAMRFHRGLAQLIVELAGYYPSLPVVLGGGVFQNRVLVELISEHWPDTGQELGLPGKIPPNDGGLAAGQLAVALATNAFR